MTRLSLILRNLRHFRAANAAVIAGMAVATAVLTGALMVGDSVRDSLEKLAVQRLGRVDFAMAGPQFVEQSLAGRLAAARGFSDRFADAVPAVTVRGGASNEERTSSTGGVQIGAIGGKWIPVGPNQCILNGELAQMLAVEKTGEAMLLRLPALEPTPKDSTLARRSRSDTTSSLRAALQSVASAPGMESLFNLQGGQRVPRNAWVNLADLQDAIGQPGRANAIFVTAKSAAHADEDAKALNALLRQTVKLGDYGLSISHARGSAEAALQSLSTYITPNVNDAADAAAKALGVTPRRVSAYLINTVTKVPAAAEKSNEIHYAIAVGISSMDQTALAPDEIAINQWAADRLDAKVGDSLRLNYYERQPDGQLADVSSDRPGVGLLFRIARILPMTGLGADPSLTPEYKGFTDKATMGEWDAPKGIAINKKWIGKEDETYWKQHRAAPKLFLNLQTAARLWGGAYGDITSIRIPAEKADAFAADLLHRLDPAAMGLSFRAVKAEQVAASGGSGEFAMTFVAFSFFLIAAAVLLVAMLFRLSIEQRARQLGLLAAVGFGPRMLRQMALEEGMLLAVLGALVGTAAAIGYTGLMMAGLRSRNWWLGAVGTTELHLHIEPITLLTGLISSLVIALLAILWGVWRVGRTSPARLLAGAWAGAASRLKRGGRVASIVAIAFGVIGVLLLTLGVFKVMGAQEAFLGGGAMLLIACLSWLTGRLRRGGPGTESVAASITRLGVRNAARHPARSVLTAALIASATFILVIVAGMRQQKPPDTSDPKSGAGGFSLILQADIPLLGDMGTPQGRDLLGILKPADPIWSRVKFTSLRRWAGQDVSCLNMTRPTDPTLLAVPPGLVQRNAFTFSGTIKKMPNPWTLLDDPAGAGGAVPIIADANTADYILHKSVGDELIIHDGAGAPRRAKLVGTLAGSIFQSELLMGEANFRALFPEQSGYGVVLVDASAADAGTLVRQLGSELDEYAVTADSTAARLAMYDTVANTYLSTFQTLGSLGLLLGTIGLAVVLLRGLVERKAELAMLAALGFQRLDRLRLVLVENAFLLLIGLGIGVLCAVIAVLPAVIGTGRRFQAAGLAGTLGGVLATGMIVLVLAVWFGGRRVTAADLREE